MARTRQADYKRSNRHTRLAIPDGDAAARLARQVLAAPDAAARQATGQRLLDHLSTATGIATPELVVPDEHQPHRRSGGRIVYSLQGDYRRRQPSPRDPKVARGGRPIGRIRVLHRTPARGAVVRPSAFLHTLLHEFCHHHDAEALGLLRSFHTAGFYARLRHLREQVERAPTGRVQAGRAQAGRAPAARAGEAAGSPLQMALPFMRRLWSIIRAR
jgi:hypothetical protein